MVSGTPSFFSSVSVTPVPSSRLVQISYKHPSPEMAARVPNAFAANFIAWQPRKRPHTGTITEAMKLRFAGYLPPEE